eukprot:Amastigsp_a677882_7.p2 type:complete len:352 gc:universal Amastigsp_a677882_7:84-1139(+)
MAKTPLSYNERSFLRAALTASQRVDGRGLLEYRRVKISFPGEPGAAEVQLGTTRVHAVVSAELVEPFPERATEGFFHFSTELSGMCSERFRDGERGTRAASLQISRLIERTLRDSSALDVESLCVIAGVSVWSVRVDIHVLDHDGNLNDGCCLAAAAALQHFRRPDVTVDNGRAIVHPMTEREPVPLSLHHVPLCVTFGVFDEGAVVVVDPSAKEEDAMDSVLVVAVNAHREVCCVDKAGGQPLPAEVIVRCVQTAAAKAADLAAVVSTALEKERKRLAAKYRAAGGSRPDRYEISGLGNPVAKGSEAPGAEAAEAARRAESFASDLDALLRGSGHGASSDGDGGDAMDCE